MKINEIITEALKTFQLPNAEHKAVANKQVYFPDIPSHYYDMYRMGVNIAAHDGKVHKSEMNARYVAPANTLMFNPYTEEELDMVKATGKDFGEHHVHMVADDSREPDKTNTVSPVQQRGPIKKKTK
jgi:hypothetical protein